MASDFDFFDLLAKTGSRKIRYLLFDCDNTLVESEDIASEICSDLINDLLDHKGFSDRFSSEDLIWKFVGLHFRRILVILQEQFGFAMTESELQYYVKIQEGRVIARIREKTRPCPGVPETLAKLQQLDDITLAVASSSSLGRIRACLETAGLDKFFDEDKIFSAANSLPTPSSKPSPAVYQHALGKLEAKPDECLAVEDSMCGVRAAVGAGLRCLGYSGSTQIRGQRIEIAQHLLKAGCAEIMWHWGNYGRHLSEIEAEEREKSERLALLQETEIAAEA